MVLTPAWLAALFVAGVFAGGLGAIVGIGGGVVLVPLLVLVFHVHMHTAISTSLVAVVATSTAAGGTYVGSGLANMRLGMSLEVATCIGGISGSLVALLVSGSVLAVVFSAMMLVSAVLLARGRDREGPVAPSERDGPALTPMERRGSLEGVYWDDGLRQAVAYRAEHFGYGSAVALFAGAVSGLLGVGGGFLKVPAMTLFMKVPIRVAAATSNFMIGVTAVASLFVYFVRGTVHPTLVAPIALGVTAGALFGTHLAKRLSSRTLRWLLAALLVLVAVQMLVRAARGGLVT